ncbi:MAG: yngHB [Firmicutes bacterium]|nr:yngHB [Bacillota bacterium]
MAQVEIKSDISGMVWKIDVSAGASVNEEDAIITLESMKMEIPVTAPANGIVKEILVKEGDVVEEEQTVAILEV